jgi:hypothetical protein
LGEVHGGKPQQNRVAPTPNPAKKVKKTLSSGSRVNQPDGQAWQSLSNQNFKDDNNEPSHTGLHRTPNRETLDAR